MFTGLIQQVGQLSRWEKIKAGQRLIITSAAWAPALAPGESLAVNGACLTIVYCQGREIACDVLQETLQRTTLGAKQPGAALNLERAVRMGDPLGGHMLTGHVDGVGTLLQQRSLGRDWLLQIACSSDLLQGMVHKGSIAVDGISLTIANLDSRSFTTHIIPFTWQHSNLHILREGSAVNLETDIIGKHVRRWLETTRASTQLTMERLRQAGFDEANNDSHASP